MSGWRQLCSHEVDEVEGNAGEELANEVEQVWQPGRVDEEGAGNAAQPGENLFM